MSRLRQNKEFVISYINAINDKLKTRDLLKKYNADMSPMENILFLDSVFPRHELIVDEVMAEGDRVIVRARLKGRHEGNFLGIAPTNKEVEFSYVAGYEVHHNKITNSWLIQDLLRMLEQLGVKGQLL